MGSLYKQLVYHGNSLCLDGTYIIGGKYIIIHCLVRYLLHFLFSCHFLDSAYPLFPQLLTPYLSGRSGTRLTRSQKTYNKIHSTTRQKIENTFSLLVSRWRFLYRHLYLNDVNRITRAIMSCCVLHNMCIDNGETIEMDLQLDDMLSSFEQTNNDDGAEFTLDNDTLVYFGFDINADFDRTERQHEARLRYLKRRGQAKRIQVKDSL